MKHKSLKIGAAALVCVMLLSVFAFSLVSYSDSDGNDPLVTLSYLTGVLLPQFKKDVLMVVAKTGGTAIIASLENAGKAVKGESGTVVHN